jgi:hypothetical protein
MTFDNFLSVETVDREKIKTHFMQIWSSPKPDDWPCLYRADGGTWEWGETYLEYWAYKILSYTPSGVWIEHHGSKGKKFVNLKCVKQWASATKEEALLSLEHRRRRQIRILSHQLQQAEAVYEAVKHARKS